jgi:alpha-L-fucosidase 2
LWLPYGKFVTLTDMRLRLILPVLILSGASAFAQHGDVLWYSQPAPVWTEALPLGNGRLGAMVFGGANTVANNGDREATKENDVLADGSLTRGQDEHLQLNECTLWSGDGADHFNPKAHDAFVASRKLLLESKGTDAVKITEAEKVAAEGLLSGRMPSYSTLGDLYLRSASDAAVTGYRRQLDLASGVQRTTYAQDGVHFTREVFASYPAQVIVMRISADKPGRISFTATMDRPSDFSVATRGGNHLTLSEGPEHKDLIRFLADVEAVAEKGTVRVEAARLIVEKADSVTLLIAMSTDFRGGLFPGGPPAERIAGQQKAAAAQSYDALRAVAIADHARLFSRLTLQLGPVLDAQHDPNAGLATDVRLKRVAGGADDLGLQALYFDYARYLLICSSRDTMPANLQGLWAAGIDNPWGSKYTINVNTEMNYWLAEPAALGDTSTPLFNLLDVARTTGTAIKVAKTYYGAGGFVIHHNTDIWGEARPIDGIGSGIWPMGGAWLTLQAWEHYAFSGDKAFLAERAWPLLEGSSQFFLDYLTPDGEGHLVTGPSLSPENKYKLADGSVHSLTMAPTMDVEIVRELFTRTLEAGRVLGKDRVFLERVEADLGKLPPFKVGKLGTLQEWQQDYDEAAPGHRHISHLWALFPGTQITPEQPALYIAARATLERRLNNGGGQTGWSRAWVVNYWDHLHDGDQAYESMQVLFKQSTFPNLMDTHPPGLFQIDGNLGAANGMLEALAQSRWEPDHVDLELLPALPQAWAEGSVRGMRVRGGGELSLMWKDGVATSATLHVMHDQRFVVRCTGALLQVEGVTQRAGESVELQAVAGRDYRFVFQRVTATK